VRFDAAQTLTVAEQLQARTNIGAVAASDVGNTDTDFVVIFDGRWPDEPRVQHGALAGAHRFRGQDQDRRHPSRLARAWVSFGYVGGQVVIAPRTTWPACAHGGGPVPRAFRDAMPDANYCWTALARSSTNTGQQRGHRARQLRPQDRRSTSTSPARRRGVVRRLLRNQPGGVPLMAYTEAQLQALEAALAKGESASPSATRPSSTARSMN
jgi:hypothetical protein